VILPDGDLETVAPVKGAVVELVADAQLAVAEIEDKMGHAFEPEVEIEIIAGQVPVVQPVVVGRVGEVVV